MKKLIPLLLLSCTLSIGISAQNFKKSIYIWSSALTDLSNENLLNVLKENHIQNAIVSIGLVKHVNYNSIVNELANNNRISVEYMISNNKLLWDADRVKPYLDSVFNGIALSNVSAIHVDVEPQAMKDSGVPMPQLMADYLAMLKEFKQYATRRGKKLAISVPLNGSKEYQREIYELADRIYIMAYETVNARSIINKVEYDMRLAPNKIIVAIRTQEFKSKDDMADFMEKLNAGLQVNQFAIHDLKRWIKL